MRNDWLIARLPGLSVTFAGQGIRLGWAGSNAAALRRRKTILIISFLETLSNMAAVTTPRRNRRSQKPPCTEPELNETVTRRSIARMRHSGRDSRRRTAG